MAYGKSRNLVTRAQSDKLLRDKAFKITSDPNMMDIKEDQHQWFTSFFDKKSSGSGVAAESNYQLKNEFHRQITRKFQRRKFYLSFRDNIWGVDLTDMQSLSKQNKGIKYLLCAFDLFRKYAWVVPLKDKRGIIVVNVFQRIISKGRKPNKIQGDQGGEF